jgi:hypothetical protein
MKKPTFISIPILHLAFQFIPIFFFCFLYSKTGVKWEYKINVEFFFADFTLFRTDTNMKE